MTWFALIALAALAVGFGIGWAVLALDTRWRR